MRNFISNVLEQFNTMRRRGLAGIQPIDAGPIQISAPVLVSSKNDGRCLRTSAARTPITRKFSVASAMCIPIILLFAGPFGTCFRECAAAGAIPVHTVFGWPLRFCKRHLEMVFKVRFMDYEGVSLAFPYLTPN
jgi:hypothetical protein